MDTINQDQIQPYLAFISKTNFTNVPIDVSEMILSEYIPCKFTPVEMIRKKINTAFKRMFLAKPDVHMTTPKVRCYVFESVTAGNLPLLQWLLPFSDQLGIKYTEHHAHLSIHRTPSLMALAAKHGRLHIVKWLLETQMEKYSEYTMDYAAENGHLEIVEWLHINKIGGCTQHAMNHAAENGHLETVIWLHENRTEGCTTWAMDFAASNGHLKTVVWLHENRQEGCTTNAMDYAAGNGHLETIIWLHATRNEGCSPRAFEYAALGGHVGVIEWLYTNKPAPPRPKSTIDAAALAGHLDVIIWVLDHGYEVCTKYTMKVARRNKQTHVVEWLTSNCPDIA